MDVELTIEVILGAKNRAAAIMVLDWMQYLTNNKEGLLN